MHPIVQVCLAVVLLILMAVMCRDVDAQPKEEYNLCVAYRLPEGGWKTSKVSAGDEDQCISLAEHVVGLTLDDGFVVQATTKVDVWCDTKEPESRKNLECI